MLHKLKIEEVYLDAKLEGDKLFEIRVNDRGYQKGDMIEYREYKNSGAQWTHLYEITYVCHYMQQGSFCVFGERHISSTKD